ncbi:MAG: GNAT family N-acetyltransferase, partial [Clostridiales bacterium]|nr:GNAT family N-acetyltransferase [Clostridiales bacterium]
MEDRTINTPALETERLILRKFTENDLEALLAIYGDEEVNTYLPWFP